MSREAALDLRQVIRKSYDAVVVMGLQRSRPFGWPTNCAFPDLHNTLVHRQSELAAVLARPPRSAFLIHVLAGTRRSVQPICLMSSRILWISADDRACLLMSGESGMAPGHCRTDDDCTPVEAAH